MHFINVESYFNSNKKYYICIENIACFYSGDDNQSTVIRTTDGVTHNVKGDISAALATLIKKSNIGMIYSF